MPKNVLEVWPQILAVAIGILVLVGAALAFSFRYRTGAEAGRRGHRDTAEADVSHRVSPGGWIDSFAGRIEEAGGGLPRMGLIIILVTIVWYFAYLLLFWAPR